MRRMRACIGIVVLLSLPLFAGQCSGRRMTSASGSSYWRSPWQWRGFRNGLIAEDWVITDLAERLLLARKG